MTEQIFRIGVVADCQYADANPVRIEEPAGSGRVIVDRFYRQSLGKLRHAIETFNELGVDAIINLGDSVDRDIRDVGPVMDIFHRAKAPVWSVMGNHDFAVPSTPAAAVVTALEMPSSYYEKSIANFRFLLLDTNELGTIQYPPDSAEFRRGSVLLEKMRADDKPNAHDWNGGVGAIQLEWLRGRLADVRAHGEKAVLVTHHPFFPTSTHNMLNDAEFCDVVRSFPEAVVAFSGHDHEGNLGLLDDMHCITMRGMVEHEDNAFAVAQFYPDRVEIEGFGREPSTVLAWG